MFIPPATIILAVSTVFPATVEAMTGPYRHRNCTDARYAAAWFMRKYSRSSNAQIAAAFNRGNHSSGAYMHRKAGDLIATDPQYRAMVAKVGQLLGITLT